MGGGPSGRLRAVTAPVLDLDGRVVDRKREIAELRAAVEASERSGGGCVLISGVPGVGKSTLTQALGAEVSQRDCVFAYGRCRDGAPAPYAALRDALGSIVRTMEATGPAERDGWRTELVNGMSGLTGVLGELVPELGPLLGGAAQVEDRDAADARRRLHRAVIRLVSATAAYRPVVLAIDDLQWADRDTLLLLSELLSVSLRNVLVLGAHRAGEFDPDTAGFTVVAPRCIELDPLGRKDVEELLSMVSGPGLELGDVAAEFQHRTGGNPLQVRQLLYRAQLAGALIPVGAGGHPSWDLRVLSSIEVSATAAEFLGHYVDQLRPNDRAVLSALSCVGGEFDLADAAAAADQPADVVAHALWSALELRLIEALDSRGERIANAISLDARYRFSHDRIAETARDALPLEAQRETHLRIGRRMVALGDERLFEAARHVGIGGAGSVEDGERRQFVSVLRRAAAKARAQASFPLALEYCRNGLELLGQRRWTDDFELTRELQLDAAQAALLVGDMAALHTLLDKAAQHLAEPADRARIAYLRLKGHVAENRLQDALETGLRALEDLGEPIASDPGKPRMAIALAQMKLAMRRWTTDRLLALPDCQDRRVIEIQRILDELRSLSYIVRLNILPLVVRKQLDLTLAHGHTPSSPLVLVSYGLLLVVTGDSGGAQRFGEVGLQLADREEFRQARPETVFMYLNFIRHWRHPMHEGFPQLRDAVAEALDQGDQEYAGFLAAVLLSQSFWAGQPLPEIDLLARTLIPEIRSQPVPRLLCQAVQQICLNLMGRSEDPFLLAGESGFDEREAVPAARLQGDEVTVSAVATQRLGLYFWTGDYASGAAVVDEVMEHIDGMAGNAIMQLNYMVSTLCQIHAAPRARATRRAVRKALALHRKWAAESPANYAAPYALIQGTWARVCGRHREAEKYLDQAMALADENHLPMLGAVAHEEAAALYTETGRVTLREHMLRSAYQRFVNGGMTLRADRLAREHPWLLSRHLADTGSGIDPVGARHLVRALSAAQTSDSLVALMVRTAADITGAQRVLYLSGDTDHPLVHAVHEQGTTTTIDGPWTEVPYDRTAVSRVMGSRAVHVDGAGPVRPGSRAHRQTAGPSVLAAPVMLQDNIIGVVYAERERGAGAFTPEHEEAVAFLCAQAAAPLWNFQLEARLHAADEYRRTLMDVQSRFVPNELLRILDIDDLRRVHSGYRVDREMTVLISDIRGYTTMLEDMNVAEASNLAMGFLRAVEMPIISCNGMIQDVRGDEIVAVFESEPDAVRAALAMLRSLREYNAERKARGSAELRAGIGINTGMIGVGLVGGVNRMVLTIIGDAVNLAARIESTTKRYGCSLLISDATYARLADPDEFSIRRMERVMVVNRRRPVTIFEVYDEDPMPLRTAKAKAQPLFDEAFALFDAGDVAGARAAFERCADVVPDDPVAPLHVAHCDAVLRGEMFPGQEVALEQK